MSYGFRLSLIGWLIVVVVCGARPASAESEAPFELTAAEEKRVDEILQRWEQWNSQIKTFQCRLKVWTYDRVFQSNDRSAYIKLGKIEYGAPSKLDVQIDRPERDGKEMPIDPIRAEHWMCDGRAIYLYDADNKKVTEHKLPADISADHLVDGPLSFCFPVPIMAQLFGRRPITPFPFSGQAAALKQEYYIREITPVNAPAQIWLEVYPRKNRAFFKRMQLIFNAKDMSPFALRIVEPNGHDYRVYQFFDIVLNSPPAADKIDPFQPNVPFGWKLISDQAQP